MKNILLIDGFDFTEQVYEGLERLKKEGCRFWLISDEYFEPAHDIFEDFWITDLCATLPTVEFIRKKGIKFDAAIVKCYELLTPLAAVLNKEFGAVGNDPKTAFICRSKYHMRSKLAEAGVPQPRFKLCHNRADVEAAIADIGVPCVVKPVGGHSSWGTFMLRDEKDLADAGQRYDQCRDYLLEQSQKKIKMMATFSDEELAYMGIEDGVNMVTDFLVEEFMDGPEVSVESITVDGKTTVLVVPEQIRMRPPYFVQVSDTSPYSGSDENLQKIRDIVDETVAAVGIKNSASHTELMMTSEGPKVVEIACRIGGDNTHDVVYQLTGYHLMEELIRLALGEKREFKAQSRCHYVMEYILPIKEGVFKDLMIPDAVKNSPQITEYRIVAKAGETVSPPPNGFDFLGYVCAKGNSPQEARKYLDEALNQIEVIYD